MTTATAATCHTWSEMPVDRPMDLLSRARVVGEQAMLSRIMLSKGCVVPMHTHENEQFACILSGRARFTVEDPDGSTRDVMMTGGQVLQVPANIAHGVEALEDTEVLDVFSPPSETTGVDRR